jgi:membrane-bound lytic murein transglycosylase D
MKTPLKKAIPYLLLAIAVIVAGKLLIFSTTDTDAEYKKRFNDAYRVYPVTIPKELNFAGEKVPLDNFEVRERIDRELLINTYWQSQTMLNLKRAGRWFPVIEPIFRRNDVPSDFVYLVVAESGLLNSISAVGATGFLQFTDATGKKYGLEINEDVDERYNVELATEAACKYLKEAKELFGSWTLAAASYNMGTDGLSKQIEKQKVKNYYDLLLSDETLRYLARIIAVKEVMTHPALYGFHYRVSDLYAPYKYTALEVDSSLTNIADFAIAKGTNYKMLKLLNPWLRSNTLPNKTKKKYSIKLLREGYTGLLENVSDSAKVLPGKK